MNVRFLTFLLTLAVAAIMLGYMSPSFAGKKCDDDPTHPSCGGGDDDPEPTAVYTAVLTSGDFVFANGAHVSDGVLLDLSANRKGRSISGDFTLEMDLVGSTTWSYYFGDCGLLLPGGVDSFDVLAGSWTINFTSQKGGPGKIHITMRNLEINPLPNPPEGYWGLDFDFDLHGAGLSDDPFPPIEKGVPSVFQLTEYMLWAGAHADQGVFLCNLDDSNGWARLDTPNTLTITRVE
jgi:hypothetical protein